MKELTMDAEAETQVVEDAFIVLYGVGFGFFDVVLIGVLGLGAAYWLYSKKSSKTTDVTATFQQYSIQPMANSTKAADNSFISKMKSSGRNVVVFYGSQTGTAEEFAGRLAKESKRYGMKGMVADPEECDMEELVSLKDIENSLAIFCMATYGEGDPTDNSQEFYEWLQSGDCDLSGLNYAVFGLGNNTYEHYNAMGLYVDKRLEELGGTRIFQLGMGNDDANIEEDFITWKDAFWPAVCEKYGVVASGEDVSMRQYKLVVHDESIPEEKIYRGEIARLHSYTNQRPPFDAKNPFMSKMICFKELHKGGDRSCIHVEIDISNSKMRYDSGDHVAVYPKNNDDLVNRMGELCNVDLDTLISLVNMDEDSSKKHPFPCPCTYRTALSYYVDITSLPRNHIFKELAEYAQDDKEKEFLKLLGTNSTEGKEKYHSWVHDDCRNIVQTLEDLPSCKPPLDYLLESLPRLQVRYYSISSSPKVHPSSIHITAAVVKYTTPTNRLCKGVATSWMTELSKNISMVNPESNPTLPVFVRKSQFRLPTRQQTPVIMIGPGTGLAPFRGFIQERNYLKEEGKSVGETIFYFGCRKKAEDFIYQEELEDYVNKGVLTMHVAFSRDQDHKVYVQHLLRRDADLIWNLIGKENAHLYVCGDAKNMARDVHETIINIVKEKSDMTMDAAAAYVKRMEAQKRYSSDVWS